MLALHSPRFEFESLSPYPTRIPFGLGAMEELGGFAFDPWDFHHETVLTAAARGHPALPKIEHKDDSYFIRLETPGVKKEDLKVELVARRTLVVTACDKPASQPTDAETHGQTPPQPICKLCKRVDVPRDADWSKVQLSYADGLLTAVVPKITHEAGEQDVAAEYGEKAGALHAEVKERLTKLQALQAALQEEQRAAAKAQQALREAKAEFARTVAEEKRQLAIDGVGAQV